MTAGIAAAEARERIDAFAAGYIGGPSSATGSR
jgi:hypothetical protein